MNRIKPSDLTRRDFLVLSAAATGGLILAACGGNASTSNAAATEVMILFLDTM